MRKHRRRIYKHQKKNKSRTKRATDITSDFFIVGDSVARGGFNSGRTERDIDLLRSSDWLVSLSSRKEE
jgi:predicted nucleotidyltransferase